MPLSWAYATHPVPIIISMRMSSLAILLLVNGILVAKKVLNLQFAKVIKINAA
jgi:hypothetical protein